MLLSSCSNKQTALPLTIAAAADLAPAFEEIGKSFEQQIGKKVIFTFGSTGTLTKQIENGAPFDLFAAANVEYIDQLNKQGLIIPNTKALYARGRITLWTRADSKLDLKKLEDLAQPEVRKVSIANPEHAPYGKAAQQALQAVGIWEAIKPKLVYGENVRMTLQFAETGDAEAAIVALSLSQQSKGRWVLIPQELHQPLDQALAVIKATKRENDAREFAAFINGPQGRPIMKKYGFILPGE
ncbi:MAG TPA: molybdate ABC transporter substrate-binding protein [Blastocatellia bacterium]|nr:molybdate ABC transporter substrate-binding protein [Blastocatellia bacterium]